MYAVFGLGNPEKKYERTRHNIGFDFIDELASRLDISVTVRRHRSLCGIGGTGDEKIILVKPRTYMNLSGEAVRAVADFYRLDVKNDIIVVYDDVSLPAGQIRIRARGSAGGHNGIKSIIAHTGTETFKRIKIGVGGANGGDMIKHVLGKLPPDERKAVNGAIVRAADAAQVIIKEGVDAAMNRFNGAV